MHLTIPLRKSEDLHPPERGVLRIWRSEVGAEAARVRQIRLERIQTAEWLALERIARTGWLHGCTNNPTQEIVSP